MVMVDVMEMVFTKVCKVLVFVLVWMCCYSASGIDIFPGFGVAVLECKNIHIHTVYIG